MSTSRTASFAAPARLRRSAPLLRQHTHAAGRPLRLHRAAGPPSHARPMCRVPRAAEGKDAQGDVGVSTSYVEDSDSDTDAGPAITIPTVVQVAGDFMPGEAVKYRQLSDATGGEWHVGPGGELLDGAADAPPAQKHTVKITSHVDGSVFEVEVPEDRYVLMEAERQGYELPFACRMGACTQCAIKVKSGEFWQPEAIGLSRNLREEGYGLMCVGFPLSDLEVETQDPDFVYEKQFGDYFGEEAGQPIERDDFALELADCDE